MKLQYLFFLGNTDPKKNTPHTLKAYSVYVQQSAHPLPLLIADLKEEIIHQILKQEGIENIKNMLYSPGYIPHSDIQWRPDFPLHVPTGKFWNPTFGSHGVWNSGYYFQHLGHPGNCGRRSDIS